MTCALNAPIAGAQSADPCLSDSALGRRVVILKDQAGVPSLSVAVFTADGEIRTAAWGVRDIRTGVAVTTDDAYAMGSLTKTVTALVVGSLVDDGRLSFDATLEELLPDNVEEMSEGLRGATLGQLLEHTSGLPGLTTTDETKEIFGDADFLNSFEGDGPEQRSQILPHALALEPTFTPGTDENYSNLGYILIGAIAERAAGESWEDLVQARIADPLGLSISVGRPDDLGSDQPLGHYRDEGRLHPVGPDNDAGRVPPVANSAGGLTATPHDWAALQQAQLRGLLGGDSGLPISADTLRLVHVPSNPASHYSYGSAGGEVDGVYVSGGAGGEGTYLSYNLLVPDEQTGAVVSTNAGEFKTGFDDGLNGLGVMKSMADFAGGELTLIPIDIPLTTDEGVVFQSLERGCVSNPAGNADILAAFEGLSTAEAVALANAVAPDDARIAPRVMLAPAETLARLLETQTYAPGPAGQTRYTLLYGHESHDISADLSTLTADLSSNTTAFAIDRSLTDRVLIGGAFSYGEATGDLNFRRGRAQTEAWSFGGYARYGDMTGFYAGGQALYSAQTIKTHREIATSLRDLGVASAERDGRVWLLDAAAGYQWSASELGMLTPFLGVRHEDLELDGVAEMGSELSLVLQDQSFNATYGRAGLIASTDWDVSGWTVTPGAELAYSHQLRDDDPGISTHFDDAEDVMTFRPAHREESWVEYGASIGMTRGPYNFSLGISGNVDRDASDELSGHAKAGASF